MEEEVKKKTTLKEFIEEHPTATFWVQFALYSLFACILPFSFIAWRFELFQTVSKIQIGGWGIVGIVIIAVFVITVIKYIRIAFTGHYSFWAKCLTGFCKTIIPLVALLLILKNIKSNVDLFMQVVGCVIICECVAIPINPLPKWAYEKQKDLRVEERKEATDYFLYSFFSRQKEGK